MKLKRTKMMILGLALSFLTTSSYAQFPVKVEAAGGSTCVIPKVDGERVPFPLRSANTKFDLAIGETYLLTGTLVMMDGKSFFKVDFNAQPWLQTEKMLANPYFPVDGIDAAAMNDSAGKVMQLAVVAQKNDIITPAEGHYTWLKLSLILPPMEPKF